MTATRRPALAAVPGVLPDYAGGGITNLMASVAEALGVDTPYPPLSDVDTGRLASRRHIVVAVVDGMGFEFLGRFPASFLASLGPRRLTSVFPSTTASAMTTYYTAAAPQQHAITGWFMYLRELGSVAAILPFRPRWGGACYSEQGVYPSQIIASPTLSGRLAGRAAHIVSPSYIVDSDFSQATAVGAHRHGYTDLAGFFAAIRTIIASRDDATYTLAYWPGLDALAHQAGIGSAAVAKHFTELDQGFAAFIDAVTGHDCTLLIGADHGLVDTTPQHVVDISAHPTIARALVLPLCGEPRAAYCYVHPARQSEFEHYVADALGHCSTLLHSREVVDAGWFGPGVAAPALGERVGHYLLLMHAPYVIKDRLANEQAFGLIGVHGGLSPAEMYVPLVRCEP